jgi:hypothetical protein
VSPPLHIQIAISTGSFNPSSTLGSESPGGGGGFIADTYSNAYAGYSVRKMRSEYEGSAIRVRIDGSTDEQDIGFDSSGNLDQLSLTSFVGSGTGLVSKWYDQIGSNDAVQYAASEQPMIVDAGTIVTINSKPAIQFDGEDDDFHNVFNAGGQTDMAFFSVSSIDSTPLVVGDRGAIFGRYVIYNRFTNSSFDPSHKGSFEGLIKNASPAQNYNQRATLGGADEPIHTLGSMVNGTVDDVKTFKVRFNGTESAGLATEMTGQQSQTIYIGSRSTDHLDGHIQELLVYFNDQVENVSNIESNMNSYYSVYS